MTPAAAGTRPPRPTDRRPPAAVVAGVLAALGAVELLYAGFLVAALGGLSADGAGRAWALLPLAAGVAVGVGGARLLRRRGWRALAAGAVLAAAFLAQLAVGAGPGDVPGWGVVLLLLGCPVLALGLALLRPVQEWLAGDGGPGRGAGGRDRAR